MPRADLLDSFQSCLKYKQARSWQKPWIGPARFLRNQVRKWSFQPAQLGELRVVSTFFVHELTVVAGENVSEEIGSYGLFEPALTEAFLHSVQPGDVVVDIGMHLGYYTTLFACLVGEKGEVHAFEPTPSTRELARHNTGRFPQVTVHPYAVWSDVRTITFQDYGPKWMAFNSFTKAKADSHLPSPTPFETETTTLDRFRQTLGKPIDVIKIDAEAAEEAILAGAKQVLEQDRPIVTLEVGDYADISSRKRIEMLRSLRFTPWELANGKFVPHQERQAYRYDNLIFAPSERSLGCQE